VQPSISVTAYQTVRKHDGHEVRHAINKNMFLKVGILEFRKGVDLQKTSQIWV
jgi:hypothetical protein